MPELVADCPRCKSKKITFDLLQHTLVSVRANWQHWFETFCVCRYCKSSTVFLLSQMNYDDSKILREIGPANIKRPVNDYMKIEGFISLKDFANIPPPEHIPENIKAAFIEGTTCLTAGCYNAAATMFRLCIDLASRFKLPTEDFPDLNAKVRRDLGLRLPWLFNNNNLPEDLRELSMCVKEDGNDGAHLGSIRKEDAEDLFDFTMALLERIYTEPERIRNAKLRRAARRNKN